VNTPTPGARTLSDDPQDFLTEDRICQTTAHHRALEIDPRIATLLAWNVVVRE